MKKSILIDVVCVVALLIGLTIIGVAFIVFK
jgi:hypothetical protein